MYADDAVMWSTDHKQTQGALCALKEWSEANQLQLNTRKTKAMKFRKGEKVKSSEMLHVAGQELEFVNQFLYLGALLTLLQQATEPT